MQAPQKKFFWGAFYCINFAPVCGISIKMTDKTAQMYREFEIENSVTVSINDHLQPIVTLRNESTSSETDIYAFGATVTAWRKNNSRNILFLSDKSDLSGGKAIRGGIPLVFPQFRNGPLPAHGFARNSPWRIEQTGINSHGAPYVTFELVSSPATLAIWPHEFIASYTVALSDKLMSNIKITNTGPNPFNCQCALHTYFSVSDIAAVAVLGLVGTTYLDKLRENGRYQEESQAVEITSETDRVYLSTPELVSLQDRVENGATREISISKHNMADAVVWNPWEAKCSTMKDLAPDAYRRFVCVEAGQIQHPIALLPNASWVGHQVLRMA